eukprot:TRINITY_DN4499_c0_g1_i1.p1 TRINITY_DN4499_c0_g1~~TRINITY_DN4499_c0_g1_i1.p1  ORF type:complete len:549 (-),score=135.09 TRINITY_DN4499_c0_g1_i1:157-1803(-)
MERWAAKQHAHVTYLFIYLKAHSLGMLTRSGRFRTALREHGGDDALVFFGGDLFNPSITSTVTKGKHMIGIMNEMGVDAGVIGNHDVDFGTEVLERYVKRCNFKWLISNVVDDHTGHALAGALTHLILEKNGLKIGVIGIVEEEWLTTIRHLPDTTRYIEKCQEAQRLVDWLKGEQGCHVVVCLAHMRWPRNKMLLENTKGIDLLLGGHDHFYLREKINGVWCVCSGVDFKTFTHGVFTFNPDGSHEVEMKKVSVTSEFAPDPKVGALVSEIQDVVEKKLEKKIGYIGCPLDCRVQTLRTGETNAGNFICDIARAAFEADICIQNAGTIRSDQIIPPGEFSLKDLLTILPFPDIIMVIEVTGEQVWQALENGVSQVPATEGRFPQVSGLSFTYTSARPAGSRILRVDIGGEPLQRDRKYSLATKTYMCAGMDGYSCLKEHKVLVDEENGQLLPTLVRRHFLAMKVLNHMHRMENIALNAFKRKTASPSVMFKAAPQKEGRITEGSPAEAEASLDAMSHEQLLEHARELQRENAVLRQQVETLRGSNAQ